MQKRLISILLILILLLACHCSKSPSPRVVVMDFMEAVSKADTTTIEKYLDLDKFTEEKLKELPDSQQIAVFCVPEIR